MSTFYFTTSNSHDLSGQGNSANNPLISLINGLFALSNSVALQTELKEDSDAVNLTLI